MNMPNTHPGFGNWMGQNDNRSSAPPQNIPPPTPPNAQNGGNPPVGDPNTDPNNQNNTGPQTDLIDSMWDEETRGDDNGGNPPPNNGNNPPANANGNGNPPAPAVRTDEQLRADISTHLGSVGLGNLEISAADLERLQGENSHQEFANLVNTRIQQAYLQAIQSSQRLFNSMLDQRLPKAVEEAVGKSKSFFQGDQLRTFLKANIPLASDPALGPIAETVFRQFMVKGADKEKALELTKAYFDRVRSAMDPNYIPTNTNTRTTFRGNPRTAKSFVDVLKGIG